MEKPVVFCVHSHGEFRAVFTIEIVKFSIACGLIQHCLRCKCRYDMKTINYARNPTQCITP